MAAAAAQVVAVAFFWLMVGLLGGSWISTARADAEPSASTPSAVAEQMAGHEGHASDMEAADPHSPPAETGQGMAPHMDGNHAPAMDSSSGVVSGSAMNPDAEMDRDSGMAHDSGMDAAMDSTTAPHSPGTGHDGMAPLMDMSGSESGSAATPDHAGHDADAPAHVHPTETPLEVGVTERLGEYLPKGLRFTDSSGQAVDLLWLIDKPTIIAPIYFNCPTVCNLLQSSLARALPEVGLVPGEEYQVLSVSFDELDTPEIAARKKRQYLTAMQTDYPPEAWKFLVGDLQNIHAFTDAIGFGFKRLDRDFAHPVILVAVSPQGRIVRYLYGNGFMPFDLAMAATEAAEGKVGLSVKRVLSFCFSYDPEGRQYTFNIMRVAGVAVLTGLAILVLALIFGGRKKRRRK